MQVTRSITFGLLLVVAAPFALAGDISGFWKNAEHPVWVEIDLEKGVGVVQRNDVYPEREGMEIFKDLTRESEEAALWEGLVFAAARDEYMDVKLSLPEEGRMRMVVKVFFMSREVDWVRADGVPQREAEEAEEADEAVEAAE